MSISPDSGGAPWKRGKGGQEGVGCTFATSTCSSALVPEILLGLKRWRPQATRCRASHIPHEPVGPQGSRRHLVSPSRSWWLKAHPWHYHTGINVIGPGYTICGTQGKIKVWALCSKRLQALMTGTTGHYTKRRPSEQGAWGGCPGSTSGVTVIFHLLPPAQFLG